MKPAPNSAANSVKREVLQDLAQVLGSLADGLLVQSDAASQVASLAGRAEQLAAQAWELGRARYSAGTAAQELAESVAAFSEDAAKLTQRAAREAAATRDVAPILATEAAELKAMTRALDGVNDKALMRARLLPMLNTLAAVPARLSAMTQVAADVAKLGDDARGVAGLGEKLRDKAWTSGTTAVAIYRELRDFADSAATIFNTMTADDTRIRQSIASISEQARQLGSPQVAAAPLKGMVWGERARR